MTPVPDPEILTPYLPKESYLIPAWISCLRYTMGQPEAVAQFRSATGNVYVPAQPGTLEALIDTATGADIAFLVAFVQWFNTNVWGDV